MPRRRPSRGPLDRFLEEAEKRRLERLLGQLNPRQKPPANNTTTTTTIVTGNGVKPPRWLGESTLRILEALWLLGPMRLEEIAEVTGLDKEVVKKRLWYWKKRGLVVHEPPHWSISSRAAALVERLLKPVPNSPKLSRIVSNQSQTGPKLVSNSPKQSQICLGVLEGLDEDERAVLNYLLRLREERGQNWTYVELLAEDLGFDAETLRRVLRRLQGRGLVYVWFDRRLAGIRVGLRLNC